MPGWTVGIDSTVSEVGGETLDTSGFYRFRALLTKRSDEIKAFKVGLTHPDKAIGTFTGQLEIAQR